MSSSGAWRTTVPLFRRLRLRWTATTGSTVTSRPGLSDRARSLPRLVAVPGDQLTRSGLHPPRRQAGRDVQQIVDHHVADLVMSCGDTTGAVSRQNQALH